MNRLLALLLLAVFVLPGCQPDLGDFRHLAEQPDVTVTILSSQVEPATNEYGSPTLKFSGVAQENKPFPVKHYFLTIKYKALFPDDRHYESQFQAEMTDGKASFQGTIYMSGFPSLAKKEPITFEMKEASWFPRTKAQVEFVQRGK